MKESVSQLPILLADPSAAAAGPTVIAVAVTWGNKFEIFYHVLKKCILYRIGQCEGLKIKPELTHVRAAFADCEGT